ncbi:MAG: hypothetical protein ACTSSK_00690 [Candidatus Heimdallarchaeota archaeon]
MTELKPVIFIRHILDSTEEILADFWNKRKIAIHYENLKSIDPKDYTKSNQNGVTKALNMFKECKEKGAIVVAIYRKFRRNTLLLGEIEKGTEIKFDEYDFNDEKVIFKTLQMKNVKELHFINYPILGAVLPRQGTITHIIQAEKVIRHLFHNDQLADTVYSLSPEQLEVICYEYLKRKEMIESLLLPIGRNLIDVDIIGINKVGNKISAQVTFAKDKVKVIDKFERLVDSIPKTDIKTKLLFFAPENKHINSIKEKYDNIEVVNIEDVFDFLKADKSGIILINNMLNR